MEIITILGLSAAILTSSSFVFQILQIIKMKEARDISVLMYVVISTGFLLWLIYGIMRKDFVIIIANSAALLFSMTVLYLKYKYK